MHAFLPTVLSSSHGHLGLTPSAHAPLMINRFRSAHRLTGPRTRGNVEKKGARSGPKNGSTVYMIGGQKNKAYTRRRSSRLPNRKSKPMRHPKSISYRMSTTKGVIPLTVRCRSIRRWRCISRLTMVTVLMAWIGDERFFQTKTLLQLVRAYCKRKY